MQFTPRTISWSHHKCIQEAFKTHRDRSWLAEPGPVKGTERTSSSQSTRPPRWAPDSEFTVGEGRQAQKSCQETDLMGHIFYNDRIRRMFKVHPRSVCQPPCAPLLSTLQAHSSPSESFLTPTIASLSSKMVTPKFYRPPSILCSQKPSAYDPCSPQTPPGESWPHWMFWYKPCFFPNSCL